MTLTDANPLALDRGRDLPLVNVYCITGLFGRHHRLLCLDANVHGFEECRHEPAIRAAALRDRTEIQLFGLAAWRANAARRFDMAPHQIARGRLSEMDLVDVIREHAKVFGDDHLEWVHFERVPS